MVVDSHNHLWFIDRSDLYWLSAGERARRGPLVRDYLIPDLREAFASAGVDRSVLVQAWKREEDQLHWLGVAEENDILAAVVTYADLADPGVGKAIDKFAKFSKFRGVRAEGESDRDPDYLARAEVRRGVRELAARGGHTLDLLVGIPQLHHVPRLAEENPDLPMVLNHLAKPQTAEPGHFEPWAKLMQPLKDFPNLQFKISGMLTEAGPNPSAELLRPAIRFMVDTFGFERLIWGSDWPVCLRAGSYKANFDMTMAAAGPMTPVQRAMLLGENAAKFYRLV